MHDACQAYTAARMYCTHHSGLAAVAEALTELGGSCAKKSSKSSQSSEISSLPYLAHATLLAMHRNPKPGRRVLQAGSLSVAVCICSPGTIFCTLDVACWGRNAHEIGGYQGPKTPLLTKQALYTATSLGVAHASASRNKRHCDTSTPKDQCTHDNRTQGHQAAFRYDACEASSIRTYLEKSEIRLFTTTGQLKPTSANVHPRGKQQIGGPQKEWPTYTSKFLWQNVASNPVLDEKARGHRHFEFAVEW